MTYASHTGLLPLLLLWPHLQFFYLLISCLSSLALLLCFSFFSYILPLLPSLLPLSYPLSSSLLLLSLPTSSILPHLLLNYSIDILFSFPLVSVPFFFVFPLPPLSLLSSWLPYIFLWSLYSSTLRSLQHLQRLLRTLLLHKSNLLQNPMPPKASWLKRSTLANLMTYNHLFELLVPAYL